MAYSNLGYPRKASTVEGARGHPNHIPCLFGDGKDKEGREIATMPPDAGNTPGLLKKAFYIS